MVSAIEDHESALHASCVSLRAAGAALLSRAQADGKARADLNGAELFDLIAALAWLREQPSHASRADRIFSIISGAVLNPGKAIGQYACSERKHRILLGHGRNV